MTEFVSYTTQDNDRWDLIADWAYGDPYGYPRIIMANPTHRAVVSFDGGITLQVPVIEQADDQLVGDELLPPWRQST